MKEFPKYLSILLNINGIKKDRKWSDRLSSITGVKVRTVRAWIDRDVPEWAINKYRLNVSQNMSDSSHGDRQGMENAPSESLPHPAPRPILEPPSASNLEITRLQTECARLDRLAAGHEGQAKAYRQAHNDLADRVAATLGRCEQLALDLRDSRGKGNRGPAAGKSRP